MNRRQRRAEANRHPKPAGLFQKCTRENLANAVMVAEQAGQQGTAELLRASMTGGIGLVFTTIRTAPLSAAELGAAKGPVIVVIGDDDYASTGPAGWACAASIAAWAGCAVIHAAGATAETYREAVMGAYLVGSAVLVETDSTHAETWAELFRPKPVLMVLPMDGAHPIMPARGAVH